MLWSTLPAVHLIFWAVYLWKLSKRWTGPNTTILQAVSSPSFQLRTLLSVCIHYLVTTQPKQSMAVVATILHNPYIGFFCYFSGYSLFLLWTIHLTIQVTFAAGNKHYIYYSEKLKLWNVPISMETPWCDFNSENWNLKNRWFWGPPGL